MEEFIVDCTNNSTEERVEVYKWLVETRSYCKSYLYNKYPVIVHNYVDGDSNYNSLESAKNNHQNHPYIHLNNLKTNT